MEVDMLIIISKKLLKQVVLSVNVLKIGLGMEPVEISNSFT